MYGKSKIVCTAIALLALAPYMVEAVDAKKSKKDENASSATSNASTGGNASTAASSSTTNSSTKSDVLQGSVKASDVEAAEGLRQMGEALKKIQRAALELMAEATRQDYISVGDPDVVGTIIIPALPSPSGMMAIGPYLPIRAKWMDYYLDQIGKLIPMYAELTDGLALPDNVKTQGTTMMDNMRPLFADARVHYTNLYNYSKKIKTTKNMKIAEEAVMLHDDFQKIDAIRRDVFKLLKDSEKPAK